MLGTRTRKIYRDIWSHKLRTMLVAVNVMIGVFGVVTLVSASDLIVSQMRHDLDPAGLPMVTAFIDSKGTPADLQSLRDQPNLTALQGRAATSLFWKSPQDDGFILGTAFAYSDPLDQLPIPSARLIEGELPGEKELMIERRMARRYKLEVGDQIVIRNLKNLAAHTDPTAPIPEETWRVSGIVFQPSMWEGATTLYTTLENLQTISTVENYDLIEARFTDFPTAEAEYESFLDRIRSQTSSEIQFSEVSDPANQPFLEEIDQWALTLNILAILAMIVSGFLVFTVISTLVVEQRRQIGVMKSLGATRIDNFNIYSGVAMVYGIIGMIPGVLLGTLGGYGVAKVAAPLIGIIFDKFAISPAGITAGVLLGLLTPIIASIIPVSLGIRVSILNALTDLGISSGYGRTFVARIIGTLPLPVIIRQALANIWQRSGRLALTGFTLTLAVASFMGISSVFMSMDKATASIFKTNDYELGLTPENDADYPRLVSLLEGLDNVKGVYPAAYSGVDLLVSEHETADAFAIGYDPANTAIHPNLVKGSDWRDDPEQKGVIVTQELADAYGYNLNDSITISKSNQPETAISLPIVGITDYTHMTIFMPWQPLVALTEDRQNPATATVQLKNRDVTAADVDKEIGQLRELLLQNGMLVNFYNQVADKESNTQTILTVGLIFMIAAGVMASVGAVGLLTMLSISVFERQREIGVMRSVGAGSMAVALQFLVEGLMIGVIAWLLGVPLGYGVGQLLLSALPVSGFGLTYPIISIAGGLIGILLVSAVASLWPSFSAARKTVSDILRYQ